MNSSLEYWNDRWAKAPSNYASSWPDQYARALELLYLQQHLPKTGTIVEIGCGAFGLAEDPALAKSLHGRYIGVDGSPVAIEAARSRFYSKGLDFRQLDLTAPGMIIPGATRILSKRTLQNITPEARGPILKQVLKFQHGLLIEDCAWAREETNRLRAMLDRGPLAVPDYNYPLQLDELMYVWSSGASPSDAFMGYFYALTRVFPDLPKEGFEVGFALSQRAILLGEPQPLFGPVIAIRW